MDNVQEYNSFDYENYSYIEEPPTNPNNILGAVDTIDFDDFVIEYYKYDTSKLSYLSNYIYPFWRQQFISSKIKEEESKNDMFNPYSTWSNTDLARHNMGLKDNTMCFQMIMCDVPIGFCSLLLLDEFDRTDRFSPFSNEIYEDSLVFYNYVIEAGFRGQGYGRKLLDIVLSYICEHLSDKYKYVVLYVDKDNEKARSLYEKAGFVLIGDNPASKEEQVVYKWTINHYSHDGNRFVT
jgi:ribosomal protein S18 acetylase RimI-like enzyme